MPQTLIDFYGRFKPTGVDDSDARRLQALAGVGKQIGGIAFEVGKEKAIKEGEKRGLLEGAEAAKEGTPIAPRDSILPSFFDDAYNRAMKTSYIAGVETDAREAIGRIAIEAGNDSQQFDAMTSEWLKGAREGVHQELMPLYETTVGEIVGSYRNQVLSNELKKNKEEATAQLEYSLEVSTRDALSFASLGDDMGVDGAVGTAYAAIDAQVLSGDITEAAAKTKKRNIQMAINSEKARAGVKSMLQDPQKGILSAMSFIETLNDTPLADYSPEEQRTLIDVLSSDVGSYVNRQNRIETEEDDNRKKAQENKATDMFLGVLTGTVDQGDIAMAASSRAIDLTHLGQLTNLVNNRGKGRDMYPLINEIHQLMVDDPSGAKQLIMLHAGSNLTEATASQLWQQALNSESEEPKLNTSVAKRARKFLRDMTAVVGPLGAIDFDSQKKLAKLEMVFNDRVMNDEDPLLVADELVDMSEVMGESSADIDQQLEDLKGQLVSGQITDSYYNAEQARLSQLKKKIGLSERFEKQLQQALKGAR